MARRLLWTGSPFPVIVASWLLLLGWHRKRWEGSDGFTHGPFHAWQVSALVAVAVTVFSLAASKGNPVVAAVLSTLTLTVLFASDSSGTDDSGLWAVGALLVFLASAAVTGVGALIVRGRARR